MKCDRRFKLLLLVNVLIYNYLKGAVLINWVENECTLPKFLPPSALCYYYYAIMMTYTFYSRRKQNGKTAMAFIIKSLTKIDNILFLHWFLINVAYCNTTIFYDFTLWKMNNLRNHWPVPYLRYRNPPVQVSLCKLTDFWVKLVVEAILDYLLKCCCMQTMM